MSADYPDDRIIAWVVVRGDDGTEKRIPWLRDPKTPEELALTEQAVRIIRKAQEQQDADAMLDAEYESLGGDKFRDRFGDKVVR